MDHAQLFCRLVLEPQPLNRVLNQQLITGDILSEITEFFMLIPGKELLHTRADRPVYIYGMAVVSTDKRSTGVHNPRATQNTCFCFDRFIDIVNHRK